MQNYTFVSCFIAVCSNGENRQTATEREPLQKANKAKPLRGKTQGKRSEGDASEHPLHCVCYSPKPLSLLKNYCACGAACGWGAPFGVDK